MLNFRFSAAAILFGGLSFCCCALAAPITYDLVIYDPPGNDALVSGTITTNGTLGSGLDPNALIIDYTITIANGGATDTITFAADGLTVTQPTATLTASATELRMDFVSIDIFDPTPFICFATCGPQTGLIYGVGDPDDMSMLIYYGPDGVPQQASGQVGSDLIGTAAEAAVPAPTALSMMVAVAAAGLVRRRRRAV